MITANGSSAINTSGEKAHGIWAQSLGGGGASVSAALKTLPAGTVQRSNSSGSGGEIRIRFNGTIDTQGAGSYGIFAQSGFQNAQGILDPGRTGGDILVDYTGVLNGGDKTGAAIVVDGGRSNTILINPGSTVSARSGTAVIATFGNDMLSNAGTLIGDIDLASGNTTELNEFHNAAGGTSDRLTSIHGQSGDVAVSLKHQRGPWLFAGALHTGYGRYDSSSLFHVGDESWVAENASKVWTGGVRLRAAYELQPGHNWYVRPQMDLDVLYTYMPSYTLRGDGATLSASAMNEWTVALSPSIEAGTRVDLGQHGWLRPYVSLGATFLNNRGLESEVSFTDGLGRGLQFRSSSALPHRMLNLGAGLQLFKEGSYELRTEYKAQFGKDYRHQELSLRAAIPF